MKQLFMNKTIAMIKKVSKSFSRISLQSKWVSTADILK